MKGDKPKGTYWNSKLGRYIEPNDSAWKRSEYLWRLRLGLCTPRLAKERKKRTMSTENTDPTPDEIAKEPLMQLFKYMHLPANLRIVSQPFCALARAICSLPKNQERTTSLRKLRESKDAAVTAVLWVQS